MKRVSSRAQAGFWLRLNKQHSLFEVLPLVGNDQTSLGVALPDRNPPTLFIRMGHGAGTIFDWPTPGSSTK